MWNYARMNSQKNIRDLADDTRLKPEFLRVSAAVLYCGISRSLLYELIGSGQILSKVLRKPGHIRGIRLISRSSLDAFLTSLPDGKDSNP